MLVQKPTASCPFPGRVPVSATSTSQSADSRRWNVGYFANLVTETTGCGSLTSPWSIETDYGRQIRLTLLDFHVARARPSGYVRPRCPLYAFVREQLPASAGGGVRKMTVCGGGAERQRVVYTSTTHRVEVGIAPNDDITGNGPYFVFKYEGKLMYTLYKYDNELVKMQHVYVIFSILTMLYIHKLRMIQEVWPPGSAVTVWPRRALMTQVLHWAKTAQTDHVTLRP